MQSSKEKVEKPSMVRVVYCSPSMTKAQYSAGSAVMRVELVAEWLAGELRLGPVLVTALEAV